MHENRKKIMTLLLGFFAGLVLLEIFLRVVGWVHLPGVMKGSEAGTKTDGFVILCLGDSFTAGGGVRPGDDYPAQLERLLHHDFPEAAVKVINGGIHGGNTAMILRKIDEFTQKTTPNLIVLSAGGGNMWNPTGYRSHLYRKTWRHKFWEQMYRIKVFKFMVLLSSNVKDRIEDSLKLRASPAKDREVSLTIVNWREECRDLELAGKLDKAIKCQEDIISRLPPDSYLSVFSYEQIGRMYSFLRKNDEAMKALMKAQTIEPQNEGSHTLAIAPLMREPGRYQEQFQIFKKHSRSNPVIQDILELILNKDDYYKEVDSWVRLDITTIIQMCQKNGIRIILHSYPNFRNKTNEINELLNQLAREHAVPFVDNAAVFKKLFLSGENPRDYIARDGSHCNKKGYGVMAENLYRFIVRNGLIEEP